MHVCLDACLLQLGSEAKLPILMEHPDVEVHVIEVTNITSVPRSPRDTDVVRVFTDGRGRVLTAPQLG